MASSFTAKSSIATVASLVSRMKEDEQKIFVRGIIDSIRPDNTADIALAVSVVWATHDQKAEYDLAKRLCRSIETGSLDHIDANVRSNDRLVYEVLTQSLEALQKDVEHLHSSSDEYGSVVPVDPLNSGVYDTSGPQRGQPDEEVIELKFNAAMNHLRFVKRMISGVGNASIPADDIITSAHMLMGESNKRLSAAARDLCIAALPHETQPNRLWSRVSSLIAARNQSFHQTMGYQLWLKALLADVLDHRHDSPASEYWVLICEGLKQGDAERRKLCLLILRQSVAKGMQPMGSRVQIVESDKVASQLQMHYDRYCLVFETIILGRYVNQIQECRQDLDALISEDSVVGAAWIDALLSSSMDPTMQDSNRKMMGTWMIQSKLPFSTMPEMASVILQSSLLPWATQGVLFTSSLKERDGRTQCIHGEQLAGFVSTILLEHSKDPAATLSIILAILSYVSEKQSTIFAYALVYLLEGIGRALDAGDCIELPASQIETISDLTFWTKFPDVARSYSMLRLAKIYQALLKQAPDLPGDISQPKQTKWWQLQQSAAYVLDRHSSPDEATGAGQSQRVTQEQTAIRNCACVTFEAALPESDSKARRLLELLQDIVNDLEYLEDPKGILMQLIPTVFDPGVVRSALGTHSDEIALRNLIAELVLRFQRIAENRIYVLSPLMKGLRSAMMATPRLTRIVPVEDILIRLAENPPQAKMEPLLENVTAQLLTRMTGGSLTYEHYYGQPPGIGFAAYFDLIARLDSIDNGMPGRILDRILQRWLAQRPPLPTYSKWKTTLQLQTALICTEQMLMQADIPEATRLLNDFHRILVVEPMPRLRHLLEWIIARIYVSQPNTRKHIQELLTSKDHHSNPKYLASLTKVAVMVACSRSSDEVFAAKVATAIAILSASSKVIIRHEAQWLFPNLLSHAKAKGWSFVTENNVFVALNDYIESLPRWNDPPLERQLGELDVDEGHTLTNLVEGGYIALGTIERPLTGRQDFVKLYSEDESPGKLASTCLALGDPIVTKAEEAIAIGMEKGSHLRNVVETASPETSADSALQTKGTAYLAAAFADSTEAQQAQFDDLIVIASLIDNPYNLGGLSRVSEIFGASTLYVENPRVSTNKLFTSVSVSSHLHLNIDALAASEIPAFLRERKTEGWTVVGIEQTDRSVIIGSSNAQLPKKTVLVLGSEKEGIPAVVLLECDLLVEIEQRGVTRSLNVQTAASVVLHEYTKQHGELRQR